MMQDAGCLLPVAQIKRIKLYLLAPFLIAASVGSHGCGSSLPSAYNPESAIDLSTRLLPMDKGSRGNPEKRLEVVRKGVKRKSIVLVAQSVIRLSLQGASGKRELKFWASPVFDVGDGIQLNLFLRRGGERITVGGRYFDSARKSEDRDWIAIEVPLEIREEDQLEIEVSPGPQGESTADWLALADLRLASENTGSAGDSPAEARLPADY
jgi:hypothetical protein